MRKIVLTGLVSDKQGAQSPKPFLEVAYGYLPLVWGATLAHYLLPLLSEAGQIIPVCFHTSTSLLPMSSPLLSELRCRALEIVHATVSCFQHIC
jgi:hypothetical protein